MNSDRIPLDDAARMKVKDNTEPCARAGWICYHFVADTFSAQRPQARSKAAASQRKVTVSHPFISQQPGAGFGAWYLQQHTHVHVQRSHVLPLTSSGQGRGRSTGRLSVARSRMAAHRSVPWAIIRLHLGQFSRSLTAFLNSRSSLGCWVGTPFHLPSRTLHV